MVKEKEIWRCVLWIRQKVSKKPSAATRKMCKRLKVKMTLREEEEGVQI